MIIRTNPPSITRRGMSESRELDVAVRLFRKQELITPGDVVSTFVPYVIRHCLDRQRFAEFACGEGYYRTRSAAHRQFDAGWIPPRKLAPALEAMNITPADVQSKVPFPWIDIQLIGCAVRRVVVSERGTLLGMARSSAPDPTIEIALTLAPLDDIALLGDVHRLLSNAATARLEDAESTVRAVVRRARQACCGFVPSYEFDTTTNPIDAWRDRIVTAINRYQLAVSAALRLLGEITASKRFATGWLGPWFVRRPTGHCSFLR